MRAFRLTPSDSTGARARIEEVKTHLQLPQPAPTDTTDDYGNFPRGAPIDGARMMHGESHGREREEERRSIKEVVRAITKLVETEGFEIWNLAAPKRICNRFVENLPMALQERLTRVEENDYTGLPIKEIENVFR